MIDSIFTFKNGAVVDLHYLVAIRPENNLCWVDLYYQFGRNPLKIAIGNSAGYHSKDEHESDLIALSAAWQKYKLKLNR